MLHTQIIKALETYAPPVFQEPWDNTGWQVGNPTATCTGVLITLDCTPTTISEAVAKGCNLVISHHPLLFKGIKRLTGATLQQQALIMAVQHDVAVYSTHTALDSTPGGVSCTMARMLGINVMESLAPLEPRWQQIAMSVPQNAAQQVRMALCDAGAGEIQCGPNGQALGYDCCTMSLDCQGRYRPLPGANPACGQIDTLHTEPEVLITALVRNDLAARAISTINEVHPYQQPAITLSPVNNPVPAIGLGIYGTLDTPLCASELIQRIKTAFNTPVVRHTTLPDAETKITRMALCGGAGGEFIPRAIAHGAQAYLCSDIRYHDFLDYGNKILLLDIGHYESENCTKQIIYDIITQNFANFAVHKSTTEKNPIKYSF